MNKALLIVDIQNDFCQGGGLEVKSANKIIPTVNNLIKLFTSNKELIIATKDWHPDSHQSFAVNSGELYGLAQVFWPVHCVQNSKGSEFHPDLINVDNIVFKGMNESIDSYSAFFDNGKKTKTNLDTVLKNNNIQILYIVGLATNYCVKFTALDAAELGYKVKLV